MIENKIIKNKILKLISDELDNYPLLLDIDIIKLELNIKVIGNDTIDTIEIPTFDYRE